MTADDQQRLPVSLRAVDRVEVLVLVLVDNVSDFLSTVPSHATPELPNLIKAGFKGPLSGECLCCGHWGLSLLISAQLDGKRHTMLFDAGPEAYAFDRNSDRLGVDFGEIEMVALSHGHWDHAGGLVSALDHIHAANGGRRVPFHVNPGMFETRALEFPDGRRIPFKDIPSVDELEAHGADVVNLGEARLLLDDMFYLSGEIPRVTAYEKGLPGHMKQAPSGDWTPDLLIMDERYLAVNVQGKGVIVFTACSHAGVVNVLKSAQAELAPTPVFGAMGGFHLSGAACEAIIPETVADLETFGLKVIVPGHCTGFRAVHALLNAFGDEVVVPSAVGRLHTFA